MTDRNKGILLMIASSVFFALMATLVRLSGDLPTMEKVFFRNVVGFAVSASLIWRSKGSFWGVDKRALFIRAFFGFVALVFYFYAIDNLPLANAVILNQTSPFFVLILAFLWLREKIRKPQWVAIIFALFGVSLIVQPGLDYELFPAIIGLLSAVLAAGAYAAVRHLRLTDQPQTIVFYFTGFTTLATLPFLIFGEFVMPDLFQFLALLGVGITATIAQFLMTYAYRYCEAGELSIYAYGNTITAMFLGLLIFGELPDIVSLLGVTFVLFGAYLNYYSKQSKIVAESGERECS
ncbi:DMT family transporter [Dethiobacter alkaliphilus]|uniref:DMT family transporter n=1 Tax=Dethiobacter alkaliphilus TaxID=427926 RepID=UPI002227F84B|nr:DMT family transporter [Dethiobacter alkaliphilus]MCW3490590.1 DMT family transporter [Dethiobacter alkaliphilus]